MNETELEVIKEKIILQHEGDEKQLEVIFSDRPRLIVEAPAGYGKTTTMISRIAYLFATGGVPNPKRILGLTFSVNAALKVKREVAEKLPDLLGKQNNPASLGKKVYVTNYHLSPTPRKGHPHSEKMSICSKQSVTVTFQGILN